MAAVAVVSVVAISALTGREQAGGDESTTQAAPGSSDASSSGPAPAPQQGSPTQPSGSAPAPTAREQVSAAAQWVTANLPGGSTVLTDADVNAELDRLGAPVQRVAVDPAAAPGVDWRDYQYIVSTEGLRSASESDVSDAIESSSLLASFGPEPSQVDIRRIELEGPEVVQARREAQAAAGA